MLTLIEQYAKECEGLTDTQRVTLAYRVILEVQPHLTLRQKRNANKFLIGAAKRLRAQVPPLIDPVQPS